MAPELQAKLGKVLALLTSPHDGERLAAAARFAALLEAHDIHPSQVLANGSNGPALSEEQMSRIYDEGYARGHADGVQQAKPARDWTPSGGSAPIGNDAERLEAILIAAAKARDSLTSAWEGLLTAWEIDFSNDMRDRFETYGSKMYVSEKQWAVLDRLETKMHRAGVL